MEMVGVVLVFVSRFANSAVARFSSKVTSPGGAVTTSTRSSSYPSPLIAPANSM
jgi:hypothetical protein